MSQLFRIACVVMFLEVSGGLVVADEPLKIEGRWKVVSIELAGMPVPGFAGAELVFAGGKKVFTLPGGKIEKGTYQLNAAKQPTNRD